MVGVFGDGMDKLTWENSITDEVHFLLKLLQATKTNQPLSPYIKEMIKKPSRRNDIKSFGEILGNEIDQKTWKHLSNYEPVNYSGEEIMKKFNITPGPEIGKRQKELIDQDYKNSFKNFLNKFPPND